MAEFACFLHGESMSVGCEPFTLLKADAMFHIRIRRPHHKNSFLL